MHSDFEKDPPKPENLASELKQNSHVNIQSQVSEDSRSSFSHSNSGISASGQSSEPQGPTERSDAEKAEAVDKIFKEAGYSEDPEKFGQRFFETLKALTLSECELLRDDQDYLNHSVLSSTPYLKACQVKDSQEDTTLQKAKENLELGEKWASV